MKKIIAVTAALLLTMGAAGNILPCADVFDTSVSASAEADDPAFKKLNSLNELGVVGYDEIVASANGYIATKKSTISNEIYIIDTKDDTCVATYKARTEYDVVVGLTSDLTLMVYTMGSFSGGGSDYVLFYKDGVEDYYAEIPVESDDKIFYMYSDYLYTIHNGEVSFITDKAVINDLTIAEDLFDHKETLITKDIKKGLYAYYEPGENNSININVKNLYSGGTVKSTFFYAPNDVSSMWGKFSKDYILMSYNSASSPADLIYCYNIENSSINRTITYDHDYDYYSSVKSSYIFKGLRYGAKGNGGKLEFIEPKEAANATFDLGREDISTSKAICMDNDRWIVTVNYKNGDREFYLADMSSVEFVNPYSEEDHSDPDINPPEPVTKPHLPEGQTQYTVGPELREAREFADEMEKKYGIKIMFGDEIYNLDNPDITSFEPYVDDEFKASLLSRFKLIDQKLSKFPEGFFEKFKDENGEGGMLFRYVHYTDKGLADSTHVGNWFIFTGNEETVGGYALEHETYHQVEELISRDYPIDEKEWNTLDPEGFERFDVWAEDAVYPDCYLLDVDKGDPLALVCDDPYFLTNYCMGAGWEDRAIMIGHLFDTEQYGIPFTGEYDSKYFKKYYSYPHLKAKYDYIDNMLKRYYGYNYVTYMLGLPEMPFSGDVSFDGKIDIDDAVMLVSHIVGVSPLNTGDIEYADVDGSGKVDIEDVVAVINHINGVKPIR